MTDTTVKKGILRSIRTALRLVAHTILIPFVKLFAWLSTTLAKI